MQSTLPQSAFNSGPSAFNSQNAEAYERVMGRWSRRLAPLLIEFGGLSEGEQVLDVGCGTGSLTFALSQAAKVAGIAAIDHAQAYVDFARSQNNNGRIIIDQADACSLPFEESSFDRAYSMLVLQFIPDGEKAVAECAGWFAPAVWSLRPNGMTSVGCPTRGCFGIR